MFEILMLASIVLIVCSQHLPSPKNPEDGSDAEADGDKDSGGNSRKQRRNIMAVRRRATKKPCHKRYDRAA